MSAHSVGKCISFISMGFGGDCFGRKKSLVVAICLATSSGMGLYFVSNMYVYIFLKMVCAIGTDGAYFIAYVIGLEMVNQHVSIRFAVCMEICWIFGVFIATALANVIRYWRSLQLVTSSMTLSLLALCWLVPESPKWLLASGRVTEYGDAMHDIAMANGKSLQADRFTDIKIETTRKINLTEFVLNPVLRNKSIILLYNLFVMSLIMDMIVIPHSNYYYTLFLSGALELYACSYPLLLSNQVGRRILLSYSMMLCGVLYVVTIVPILIGPWWLVKLSSFLCRGIMTGAFIAVTVNSSSLFPTVVRCSGLGVIFTAGRLKNILADYVSALNKHELHGTSSIIVPRILFGSAAMLGGMLALLLSEERNQESPVKTDDIVETTESESGELGTEAADSEDEGKSESEDTEQLDGVLY